MRGLHATHVVIGERGDNQYKGSAKVDVKSDIYNTVGFAALGIRRLRSKGSAKVEVRSDLYNSATFAALGIRGVEKIAALGGEA